MVRISQNKAGYVTGDRCYCCKTCKFFVPKDKGCQIVAGLIIPHGCCNLWQKGKKGVVC